MDVEIVIRLIVLLLASLATGGLMVNWIGLGRAMAHMLSASAYTEFHQATNQTFDPYMPIVVGGAILGGIALAVISPGLQSLPEQFAIVGVFCYSAVIAITLPTNLRINKLIARWSIQNPPDDWTIVRTRWIRFHILRTLFSVPALASYILACLLSVR